MPGRLRSGLRFLWRTPGFSIAAISAIAIGVGANALVYSWLDSFVLNPHPLVPSYSALVAVNGATVDGRPMGGAGIDYPDFQEWRRRTASFDGLAAVALVRLRLRLDGADHAEASWGLLVTGDYFGLLGVPTAKGRAFGPDDERVATPVVVVSNAFWRTRLGGRPNPIGSHIAVNGVDLTVVGVMPPNFYGHEVGYAFDLWLPASLQPLVTRTGDQTTDRQVKWLSGVGRLRAGVDVRQANRELAQVAQQVSLANGDRPIASAAVIPFREWRAGGILFPLLVTMMVVTGLILLLGCASVATLVLVRTLGRVKELGLRLALGAPRSAVVGIVLTEVAVVALLGGLLGLMVAVALQPAFAMFVPPSPGPVAIITGVSARAVGVTVLATLIVMLLAGLVPALRIGRTDLIAGLRGGGPSVGGHRGRLQHGLVVTQLTVAATALVIASLFLRSLAEARRLDLGIEEPGQVLLLNIDVGGTGLTPRAAFTTVERILEGVRGLPGVVAASGATMVPLGFGGHRFEAARVQGYSASLEEDLDVETVSVIPGYFEMMGVRIVHGRSLQASDRAGSEAVAVVNEAFARRFFAGRDPVGGVVGLGGGEPATIVGVARDGRYDSLTETPTPLVYQPWSQRFRAGLVIHVRTKGPPRALEPALRRQFLAGHGDLIPTDVRTMAEHMEAATFVPRLGSAMLGALGAMTLVVAAVGLFGVMAFAVGQRIHEMGIRLALGATGRQLQSMFVTRAVGLASVSLLLGSGAALGVATAARNQLIGVTPGDPLAYGAVGLLLLVLAAGGGFFPSRRAARLDVSAVLRRES